MVLVSLLSAFAANIFPHDVQRLSHAFYLTHLPRMLVYKHGAYAMDAMFCSLRILLSFDRPNLSENSNKGSIATPRVSKTSKLVSKPKSESPSPLQNSRLSPTVERKSPRPSATPPDKQHARVAKRFELQNQLNLAHQDLKKTKDEKLKAVDDLKEAQRVDEEANEKLLEALIAQKCPEENFEIEKFRAGIETVKKKKEEWQKKIESVRNQHALNMDSLLSTTQELQRVKQQLALTCYAKNQALNHADDATKIVEILAEKAEFLSSELMRLKALLDSKVETEARQNQLILKLKTDIEALKEELEKSKGYDDKLSERESFIELLNVELVASKMDESYARTLLEEWHTKVEELEMRIEEANKLEIYASEYLESIMKRVEGNNDLLHEAESEVDTLKEKVELLEMTIGRQRADVEDSQCQLCKAKEESLEKSKEVEALTSELERVKEEKAQALNDVKLAASSVQALLEEKKTFIH
ncbi:putative WEB family protein, chloroplastic [Glycine max]|nr:putative WEB family protein, chloroplastic [Glycine max]